MLLLASVGFTQSVTLTFTGRDGGNRHIELEYVIVTNVTKGWRESLFWPDTVLTIQAETGVQDVETMSGLSLRISPHSSNPFNGTADVTLTVPEEGTVNLEITDMNGRVVWADDYNPLPGVHQFRFAVFIHAAGFSNCYYGQYHQHHRQFCRLRWPGDRRRW